MKNTGATTEEEDERLFNELIPAIEKAVCKYLKSEYEYLEDWENVFEYAWENIENMYSADAYTIPGEWAIYEVVEHRYI